MLYYIQKIRQGVEPNNPNNYERLKVNVMKNTIELRPSYWANVSGGKDSLYMLKLILSRPEQYPLDGVVHFELEIDYPFIKNVIDYMESECKKHNIAFLRIKPRKTWLELYAKYGYPTRFARWCNSAYKLDCNRQLEEMLHSQGKKCIHYIGYCVDERHRFEKRKKENITEIYPLADYNIEESYILNWAKTVNLYNDYYKICDRCGCAFCPMLSKKELAYQLKYYPDLFKKHIEYMKDTEMILSEKYKRKISVTSGNPKYNAQYLEHIIPNKWLPKIEKIIESEINIK